MGSPIQTPIDFDELDRLRWNADRALEWLQAREPMDDKFKEAAQARSALAIYHEAVKRAAPELIRLARIGAASPSNGD